MLLPAQHLVICRILGLSYLHLSFHICKLGMTVLTYISQYCFEVVLGRKLYADCKIWPKQRIIIIAISVSILL